MNIGEQRRTIYVEPIEEPQADPAKGPEPDEHQVPDPVLIPEPQRGP
jgi:hypothetical protein